MQGAGKQLVRQRAGCKRTCPGRKFASGPCRFFRTVFRMWVKTERKPGFFREWGYQVPVLLGVCFHCFWAVGSFSSLIVGGRCPSLFKGKVVLKCNQAKLSYISCFLRIAQSSLSWQTWPLSLVPLHTSIQVSTTTTKKPMVIWFHIHPSILHF